VFKRAKTSDARLGKTFPEAERRGCRRAGIVAFTFALPLAAVSPLAHGAVAVFHPPVRDGMPCVEEVCVGDDVMTLRHVAWQEVSHPATGEPVMGSRVSTDYLRQLGTYLRAAPKVLEAVAPYWYLRRFDSHGLSVLAAVSAVCRGLSVAERLQAQYAASDGSQTVVTFEPVSRQPDRSPAFIVAAIHRYVDRSTDGQQLAILGAAMSKRYGAMSPYASVAAPAAEWVINSAAGPHLKLLAPIGDPLERGKALQAHPLCKK
jgi:hypothetical protein